MSIVRALAVAASIGSAAPALAVVDIALLGGVSEVTVAEDEVQTSQTANVSAHIAPFFTFPVAFGAYGAYGQDGDAKSRSFGPEIMAWLPFPLLRPYAKISTPVFTASEAEGTSTEKQGRDPKKALGSAGLRWSSTAILPAPALMIEYKQGFSDENPVRQYLFGLGAEL